MVDMNVALFKSNFDGGSRANRFMIQGELHNGNTVEPIVVKAGSMPAVTLGILRVPFRGRVVKIPGDRTYEEWTCTILDGFSGKSENRNSFVAWNAEFNLHEENVPGSFGAGNGGVDLDSTDLFKTWSVIQLGMDGSVQRQIDLVKCWPVVVSELALSYDSADTISEYTVTFAYDYLEGHGITESTQSQAPG